MKKASYFLLFTLVFAVFFADALFLNRILSARDLARYFYPFRFFSAMIIRSGGIPLWDPYIFCGMPHLALQQSTVFYPLSILSYLLPFDTAFNLFIIIHYPLAGFFMFLLAQHWGMRKSASWFAGICFAFNGYLLSVANLLTTLSSVIWLPLVMLFFDRALVRRSGADIIAAALTLAVMFLGGEPSIFYCTVWIMLLYAACYSTAQMRVNGLKIIQPVVLTIVAIVGGAALVAAFQLVPLVELLHMSYRTMPEYDSYQAITMWSLPLKDTFNFIIPFLTRIDFSNKAYWVEQNWVSYIYMGVLPFVTLPIALIFRRSWRVVFLALLAGICLVIAYGKYTPFYHMLYKYVAGFHYIRYPVRFLYGTTFAFALLGGFGLDLFLKKMRYRTVQIIRFFRGMLVVLFASAVLLLTMFLYQDWFFNALTTRWFTHLATPDRLQLVSCVITGFLNAGRLLGFFVAGGLILSFGLLGMARRSIVAFSFIALLVIDFFTVFPQENMTLDRSFFHRPTPAIAYLQKDQSYFRVFVSPKTDHENSFLDETAKSRDTYAAAMEKIKDRLCSNLPVCFGIYDAGGYDSLVNGRYLRVLALIYNSRSPSTTALLNMLNVKYVIAADPIEDTSLKQVYRSTVVTVYENTRVLPRVWLAERITVAPHEAYIRQCLSSRDFDPAREAILEEVPALRHHSVATMVSGGVENAEIVAYKPQEVTIRATVTAPKLLVLADSYYPGWKVFVDGKPDKIYVTNYILRGVYLDKGEHVVRFVFDPFSFKLGAGISLATLGAITAFFLLRRRRSHAK